MNGNLSEEALYRDFFRAAEHGSARDVKAFLESGLDPNHCRPRLGDTVLHVAATCNARDVFRVLNASGKCDYLIRDRHGNLASTNAYLYGRNPALARLLSIKEKKQATEQGIPLTLPREPQV